MDNKSVTSTTGGGQSKSKKKGRSNSLIRTQSEKDNYYGKTKVDELLSRALSNACLLETITVPEERLKLAVEKNDIDFMHDSDEDSSHYGSPRRKLLALNYPQASERSVHSMSSLGSPKGWDTSSLSSEVSGSTRFTNRELIHEISRRALQNKAPPEYVPALDSLDPSLISWNRKVPKNKRSDPPVNIIGCLHPLELVLAKADKRMRKQAQAIKLKQIKCEEKVKEIDDSIKWKFSRAERYAAALALKQFQIQWLRIVWLCRFLGQLAPRYFRSVSSEKQFMKVMRSTMVIQGFFMRWYRKHMFKKIQQHYEKAFKKIESALKFRIRIVLKRRAAKKLKQFLTDFKGHHKMNVIVHRYLSSVRNVQARVRSFIVCKNAKIHAMEKIWIKLETQYIRKKLEQKRIRTKNLQVAKKNSDSMLAELGGKSFIEMKQQAKLWSRIDGRMEAMVTTLKTTGMLQEESEEEIVNRLMVPEEVRVKSLKQYLERMRKEFYLVQRNALRKQVELDATFKEHHASQLLRGQQDNLNRIINERYGKQVINLKYAPFHFFSFMDRKVIFERMKEAHATLGTFKIKIEAL